MKTRLRNPASIRRCQRELVKGGSDRGAILVPVQIAGENLKYQFDTGADTTVLYGADLASRLGWSKGRKSVKLPGIRVGETLLPLYDLSRLLMGVAPANDLMSSVTSIVSGL